MVRRRYELGEKLGEGGMGTVFRAFDTTTRQTVAVKLLRPSGFTASSADIERFLREGEALRLLNHPNIVKVFDAFQEGERHFLVMECVEGGSLESALRSGGPLPLARVLELGLDISDALSRAHRLGIVHRDVKPANVLVAADGTPRLSDFGVAHIAGRERVSGANDVVGTVDYLSPEAVTGAGVDAGADVWAFGVMLFELLSGVRPFRGEHAAATLHAIVHAPPLELETLRPECPLELADLVYRMLEKNRGQRIPSVRQVGAELERILAQRAEPQHGHDAPEPRLATRPVLASRFGRAVVAATVPASAAMPAAFEQEAQATPFVGRESELAALARLLLDPAVKLVTVVGPGGMGKSRLALETMRRFASGTGAFAATAGGAADVTRRAFLVELAPLADPELVLSAVAEAIDCHLYPGAEPKAQLISHLRSRSTLLVLDNFEHLLPAAALVGEILKGAPTTRVLATSRERLHLEGEHVFALAGLRFPAANERAALTDFSSVRLFVESARRLDRTFELTAAVAPAVVQICRLVQGLPLGVVLAASWSNVLSPAEIAQEIAKDFEFLDAELMDVPSRQHSLRAVFDYSYGLLGAGERAVFARLSSFRGGFTRRSAEAVAGASLKALAALLNKSLVSRDPESGRYRVHELLRQYAESRLRDTSGEPERVADTHAQHYAEFLRERSLRFEGNEPLVVTRELEDELDNVRAAWTRALETRNVRLASAMLEPLGRFLTFRSAFAEAEQAFSNAATSFGEPPLEPLDERARVLVAALCGQAEACAAQWRHAEAAAVASRAFPWLDEERRPLEAGRVHLVWAIASLWAGRVGVEAGEHALELYRRAGDRWETARALLTFSRCQSWLGGPKAEALVRESIELQRSLPKSAVLTADSLTYLGEILTEQGAYAEAGGLLLEALSLNQAQGNADGQLACLHALTGACRRRGEYDLAESHARAGLAMARDGFPFAETWCHALLADVLKERGQLDEAAFHYRAAMVDGNPLNVTLATFNLGDIALMRGERAQGAAMIAESLVGFERHGAHWGITLAYCHLGDLACADARYSESRLLHQRALAAALDARLFPLAAMAVASIARRKALTGELERAAELLALVERHPITERQTQVHKVAPALAELALRLDAATLAAAKARGAALDLEATVRELSVER